MYISTKASRIRQREAQRARENRAEIVKARSLGQVTRRELIRWGIFTGRARLKQHEPRFTVIAPTTPMA